MDAGLVNKLHDTSKQAMEMPNHVEALAKHDQQLMHMGLGHRRVLDDAGVARGMLAQLRW